MYNITVRFFRTKQDTEVKQIKIGVPQGSVVGEPCHALRVNVEEAKRRLQSANSCTRNWKITLY